MEHECFSLADERSVIHCYAAQGYPPADVKAEWASYTAAILLKLDANGAVRMHTSELLAFRYFLERTVQPEDLAVHQLRESSVTLAAQGAMRDWGLSGPDVVAQLGLDYSGYDSIVDLARVIEDAVKARVRCVAVTFEIDNIVIDGVEIPYPPAVRNAVLLVADRMTKPVPVQPF